MLNQEKEETQKRKQDYRRELDLIIKLKNKIRESEESQKMFDLRRQTGHVGDVLEEQKKDEKMRKEFDLMALETSVANSVLKRQIQQTKMKADKKEDLEELRQSQVIQEFEKEMHKKNKCEERKAIEKQRHTRLKNFVENKAKEKMTEKMFLNSELKIIDGILEKDQQFMNGVRHRLDKYEDCRQMTEKVQKDFMHLRRRTDFLLADKPYADRLQGELLREKKQTEEIKTCKNDLGISLSKEIEKRQYEKTVRFYEDVKEEHSLLVNSVAKMDAREKQKKEKLCREMKETLETLQNQIEKGKEMIAERHSMNKCETDMNNPVGSKWGYMPELTVQFVPGFANQFDKKLMNAYQDRMGKVDTGNLESTLNMSNAAKENNRMERSMLGNERKNPVDFGIKRCLNLASEYDYIRNKHRNGVFNIITNNRR